MFRRNRSSEVTHTPRMKSVALTSVLTLLILQGQFFLASPASAADFTGGFSPTVLNGNADLNGDGVGNGRDDSNAFYGDTHIIDGGLDCDDWGSVNDGSGGDGTITTADNCTLVGYNGTPGGVTITVVAGGFQWAGPLPTVFPQAGDANNPDVGDSAFAWSTISGRVDSDGNETINANDCHFGLIGDTVDAGLGDPHDGADILGNTAGNTNPCGFANAPAEANNGLVDLNSDGNITAADSCTNGCFFGHNLTNGFVQSPGPAAPVPPAGSYTGGFSPTVFSGEADLNGNGTVTGRDDSNAFYGDTHIIDGKLDCNAWTSDNDGDAGNGVIDANDDCTLIAYDGTPDGAEIDVVDGEFQWADGPLPFVFNADDPNSSDVGDSDFAWSAIGGRVDSNGDEIITNECHFGLIGVTVDAGLGDATDGADILGNDPGNTNPCGFANSPDPANNGLVDLNSDGDITAADSCTNGCFFGHNLTNGYVQSPGPVAPAPPPPPPAGVYTGGLSPTIIGGRADLNGSGTVTGRDDSNAFYGDTHIIDGYLDCNAWTVDNDGAAGDGVINASDDCTLIGYDGTVDGVTIDVVDGEFQVADGPLPTVFNAGDPDNPDVGDSDFAWSAISGRVDSDGNEMINANDCHFGLIGETVDAGAGDMTDGADILGNTAGNTNPCGFANPPAAANNGLVDLNSDGNITAADSCSNGCFLGHDLLNGYVMAPTISINDAPSVSESGGPATFTITLSGAISEEVTVNYSTANGTAAAPGDYTAVTLATATFAPGTTTQTVNISVVDDALDEPTENFFVNLSNAVNATILDGQGVGTITDNDPATATLSIDDAPAVTEGAGPATFTVTLSAPSGQTVTVDYATANGTATAPADYTAVATTTLTFAPGATTQTVNVSVVDDAVDEPSENFFVNLSNATNASILDGQGVGTINDNDPATATLSINDAPAVTEGAGPSTFTVTLSAPSAQTVTVDYATANGTASAPADYTSATGTVTFAPGATTQTVNVSVVDDALDEPSENFFVNLSNAVNAAILDGQGVGTINDNDPPASPGLSINDVTVAEPTAGTTTATFTVTLGSPSGQTVTVDYATANGTATAPLDYTAVVTTTLIFAPGTTTQTVDITVNADTTFEPDETFFVNLSGATNATISDPQGVGTITNASCGPYNEPTFSGDIARDVEMFDSCSGYILDGYGGLHPVGAAEAVTGLPYFPNFDIAREVVLLEDQNGDVSGGFVLDGWGGMHPFRTLSGTTPNAIQGLPYFPGNDIARDVVLTGYNQEQDYDGGYMLDGRGGIHPFGGNGAVPGPYFSIDIARELVLQDPATGDSPGYILDGYGGMHPVNGAAALTGLPYFAGNDIANDALLTNEPNSGYVLDGYGGIHPFGAVTAVAASHPYTVGVDSYKAFDLPSSFAGVVLDRTGNLWDFLL